MSDLKKYFEIAVTLGKLGMQLVKGGTMEGVAVDIVLVAAKEALDRIPSSQKLIDREWEEIKEEILFETKRVLEDYIARNSIAMEEVRDHLREKVSRREVRVLIREALFEAAHSTTHERLKLMCAVVSGAMHPDLNAETKSRTMRAIKVLEPSDIVLLRRLGTSGTFDISSDQVDAEALYSYDALVQAGCLRPVSGTIGSSHGRQLTALADDVLAFIQDWKLEA